MDSLDQQDEHLIPTQDEKNIALLAHAGTFIGGFIVPLVIWLVKKDESEYIGEHAKQSLNFQISMLIYAIGGTFISFIFMIIFIGWILMFFVLIGISILALVTTILASINASQGKHYNYPLSIPFIK